MPCVISYYRHLSFLVCSKGCHQWLLMEVEVVKRFHNKASCTFHMIPDQESNLVCIKRLPLQDQVQMGYVPYVTSTAHWNYSN